MLQRRFISTHPPQTLAWPQQVRQNTTLFTLPAEDVHRVAGTPEAGGFTTREVKRIIRGLSGLNFVGADIVEVAPGMSYTFRLGFTVAYRSRTAYDNGECSSFNYSQINSETS
jgi:hypothetical protein